MIGKYKATILHYGQPKPWAKKLKFSKCFGNVHICGVLGHRQSECRKESFSDHGDDWSSESDIMENDNKDENHVDDQENDMINNSQEEEEKIVQNPPIENYDNSRNTEAMDRNLEQSQSILGEQREGDKPPAIMKKQKQRTQYLNEKLAGNTNSQDSSKSTPKKEKGRSELLEKAQVPPPDVLHDNERERGAKKAKITGR